MAILRQFLAQPCFGALVPATRSGLGNTSDLFNLLERAVQEIANAKQNGVLGGGSLQPQQGFLQIYQQAEIPVRVGAAIGQSFRQLIDQVPIFLAQPVDEDVVNLDGGKAVELVPVARL